MFGERLFGLDAQTLFDAGVLLVTMFVLFLFLSYFLFNPVRDMLNKRKERIKGELEQASKDKEDAAKLKEEYEAKLKNVDKESQEILSSARAKALKNQDKIIDDAKTEAGRIINHAKHEGELEKLKVADDVKKEIVSVATAMAGKVAAASIDEAKQQELIDETLKEMGEDTWLS